MAMPDSESRHLKQRVLYCSRQGQVERRRRPTDAVDLRTSIRCVKVCIHRCMSSPSAHRMCRSAPFRGGGTHPCTLIRLRADAHPEPDHDPSSALPTLTLTLPLTLTVTLTFHQGNPRTELPVDARTGCRANWKE